MTRSVTSRFQKRRTVAAPARADGPHARKAGLLEMVQTKYIDVDRLPRREKPWWYRYGVDLERAADAFLRFEFSSRNCRETRQRPERIENFFP